MADILKTLGVISLWVGSAVHALVGITFLSGFGGSIAGLITTAIPVIGTVQGLVGAFGIIYLVQHKNMMK